jgi:hypothetical protein
MGRSHPLPQPLHAAFSTFTDVINNQFNWDDGTLQPIMTADQMASAFEAQSADGLLPNLLQRFRHQMNIGGSDGDGEDSSSDKSDDDSADDDRELKVKKVQRKRSLKARVSYDGDGESESNLPPGHAEFNLEKFHDPPPAVCSSPAAREARMKELFSEIRSSSKNGKVPNRIVRLLGFITRDCANFERKVATQGSENELLKRKVQEMNTNWEMLKESKKAKKGKGLYKP